MFKVNTSSNRIFPLEQKRFSDLKIRERDHLQEWLANAPNALGEELLIIQKEFDGFDNTRERLDLLALDKNGNLVVIENKLDDSGRDVVWQAIKYAAYVSSLKRAQVVEIFQQYLDRGSEDRKAEQEICDFLSVPDISEAVLNPGNDQRIIFIAANFRKEVTATVLWLLARGITAQCFKVTPYMLGEELLIDLQQIIPTPEAADYMIGMSSKENDEKTAHETTKKREGLRYSFWEETLERLKADGVDLFNNISAARNHWLSAGSGVRSCPYNLIFSKDEARVELNLGRNHKHENKWLFDKLYEKKDELEAKFGAPFNWRRMDDAKSSLVVYAKPFDGFNQDSWPEMQRWLSDHIQKLERTFKEPLAQLNSQIPDLQEISDTPAEDDFMQSSHH